jgi:hypothetical protein
MDRWQALVDRIYPDVPARRRAAVWRDAGTVTVVVLLAVLGWLVYDLVERVTVVATGVEEAGTSVVDGFGRAADAVDGVPVVGGRIAGALSEVGDTTGGRAVELGEEARASIHRAALAAGLVTFVVPAGVYLAVAVPRRVQEVQRLAGARAMVAGGSDPERRRLLATRAAFALPAENLVRFTGDPIGDLAAGRYDRLVDALYDEAGLLPEATTGGAGGASTGSPRAADGR